MKRYSQTLLQLAKILSDGAFHDGTSLGNALDITRSAVCKTIKKLTHYGVEISVVKGRGYRLAQPLLLLDPAEIKKGLATNFLDLHFNESIHSTNDYLLQQKHTHVIQVCLSEQQTAGKGRLTRYWHSPFGKNIYLSLARVFHNDLAELSGLSLVIGISMVQTLKKFCGDNTLTLKWPNDVMFKEKKIGGTLIELQAAAKGVSTAIIGIGININMQTATDDITQPWSSLSKITASYHDRNKIAIALIQQVITNMELFEKHGLSHFTQLWNEYDGLKNKLIRLAVHNQKIEGTVLGIDEKGNLKLRHSNNEIKNYSSGEASIIKDKHAA